MSFSRVYIVFYTKQNYNSLLKRPKTGENLLKKNEKTRCYNALVKLRHCNGALVKMETLCHNILVKMGGREL